MNERQKRSAGWQAPLIIVALLLIASMVLGGCGASVKATPTPTKTPKSVSTNAPLPTNTPLPTSQPTETPVPSPAASSSPTIPAAGNGGTPQVELIVPALDNAICPLTGEVVTDPTKLERRPLAIKVSNAPSIVRPQAGLDKADVVFEHVAEADLTRFTAIYLCQDAEKVGSVRSARLIDLEIPAMFKSLFAFSGASGGVKLKIKASDFAERVFSPDPGFNDPGFRRIPQEGKAFEHTLFTDTPTLWKLASERGINQRQNLEGWVFSVQPPAGGTPAREIDIVYRPNIASAEYRYDPQREAYLRYVLGEPHVDEVTGQQLTARNVVVLYVNHVETDIVEDSTGPKPYYSIEIQIWGQGRAQLFRDGRMYELTWSRPRREDMIRFLDANGNPFPLKPGNTWIQVVPLNFQIAVRP
ncbi:MAG: DUF3048 domain-containing protein [Anaerolineae bacterium]|nr:DUF3048 domain-containing protein [Anaerolineae bacterium]